MTVIRADFATKRILPPNGLADKCGQLAHHARCVSAACDDITAALAQLEQATARFCDAVRRGA